MAANTTWGAKIRKGLGLALGFALGFLIVTGVPGKRPTNLGVQNGHLAPCPDSPNCVCSQCDDPQHAIPPLKFEKAPADAWKKLREAVTRQKRTKVITASDNYLYVEFQSLIFRFVDDVEFALDEKTKTIQVRSASRVGRSDLGVNRKRIESIRAEFDALKP